MIQPGLHAPGKGEKLALEVRHYGKSDGKYLLYDDDGETFDYENGDYSWTELIVEHSPDNETIGNIFREKGTVFIYKEITWKFMTQ